MEEQKLAQFFESYLSKQSIFLNRRSLQSDWIPEKILHRDDQITSIAKVLAPLLRNERPNNLFLYGYTGTGKTLVTQFCTRQVDAMAKARNIPLVVTHINCKLKRSADTEYRLIAQLAKHLGKNIPPTGLPTDEVYNTFYHELESKRTTMLLVLDEVDALAGKVESQLLYNLLRINEELEHSRISLLGIANNTSFKDELDPRVRSSLSEEEITFPRYNAVQLLSILDERSKLAFHPGALTEGALQKCAAMSAQEHGDARRAISMLRMAGEIAERSNSNKINLENISQAADAIEHEAIVEVAKTQPKQHQLVLYSVLETCGSRRGSVSTGDIYEKYTSACSSTGIRPLTQRRVADIVLEFDMLGMLQSKVISKGRYGRAREVELALSPTTLSQINSIVTESLALK